VIDVRLRLPAAPSPALRKLAKEYFDPAGLLRREHFRSFHQVIEAFRKADLEAVIYSDVLEYLDRENELAGGLDLERQLSGEGSPWTKSPEWSAEDQTAALPGAGRHFRGLPGPRSSGG
jgi:hypothetical protein